jgi:hypothetical protein
MIKIATFARIITILATGKADKNFARPNGIWVPRPIATFCGSLAIFSSNGEFSLSAVPSHLGRFDFPVILIVLNNA